MSLSLEGASDAELIAASNLANNANRWTDSSECSEAVMAELKRRAAVRETAREQDRLNIEAMARRQRTCVRCCKELNTNEVYRLDWAGQPFHETCGP